MGFEGQAGMLWLTLSLSASDHSLSQGLHAATMPFSWVHNLLTATHTDGIWLSLLDCKGMSCCTSEAFVRAMHLYLIMNAIRIA